MGKNHKMGKNHRFVWFSLIVGFDLYYFKVVVV